MVTVLGLSGCGGGIGLSSATLTPPPAIPGEITQTATRTAVPSPTSTAPSSAKATPAKSAKPASAKPATGSKVALRSNEQRVTVKAAGITFGAPLAFGRADAEALLTKGADSPQMAAVASRLGLTPSELKNGLLRQTDTILVGSAVVMVMHLPAQEMPDDDLLRRQFEYGSGGTVQTLTHVRTKAGPGVHATYRIKAAGRTVYGDVLMIRTAAGLSTVTCTATTAARTAAVMNRVIATVQRAS